MMSTRHLIVPAEVYVRGDEATAKILGFINLCVTDLDAANEQLAGGFVWENYLPDHVPFGGRYEGPEGLARYLTQLGETWEIGELAVSETLVSNDGRAFSMIGVEKDGRSLVTGRSCDMAFVWIIKIDDDGKFVSLREYNDTAAMGGTFDQPAGEG